MNRLAKENEYLFNQGRARAHTAKLTLALEMLKDTKTTSLVNNSPDLNSIGFDIWGLLKQNAYRGQKINDLDSLKEATAEEWDKIPQEIND